MNMEGQNKQSTGLVDEDPITLNYQDYNLLIVDDNPANLSVVVEYLQSYGFKIMVARSGEKALKRVAHTRPDLILLDVMMPGLDGFETCHRLKADETTKNIPVIFMTALAGADDKVKGFAAGAVDYVTKPLHQEEVLARVTTHLRIHTLTQTLQQANKQLSDLNATKDKFFSIVAHDLRGPFQPLLGNSEILKALIDPESQSQIKEIADSIHRSAKSVHSLLENLLQWSRMEQGQLKFDPYTLNLQQLVKQNLELFTECAMCKHIHLENLVPADIEVYVDENMLDSILRNLISNALKFTSNHGHIVISARPDSSSSKFVEVSVRDTGVGIKQEDMDKLFKLEMHHVTLGTAHEKGTGLGLILCREMIQKNGGQIWIESQEGQGTIVKFTIPAANWWLDLSC